MVKESITPTIGKNNIDTVNKTEKSQASNKKVDTSISNKSDKSNSFDKSRSNQITDTENTVNKENKPRCITKTSLCGKVTK